MLLIDENINAAIILKTIKLKNIINSGVKKFSGKYKFTLVLIAAISCAISCDTFLRDLSVLSTYRPHE